MGGDQQPGYLCAYASRAEGGMEADAISSVQVSDFAETTVWFGLKLMPAPSLWAFRKAAISGQDSHFTPASNQVCHAGLQVVAISHRLCIPASNCHDFVCGAFYTFLIGILVDIGVHDGKNAS
jgi:hypothetical protein